MTIIERTKVLDAYQRALELGAHTHEEALAVAAQSLGVPQSLVEEAVWDQEQAAC